MTLILAASLPLPVSVNRLHKHDPYRGRVRLADEALEYTDTVLNLLNYYGDDDATFTPYEVAYLNAEAITRIRALRGNPSRAKAVLSQHRFYRMDSLLVLSQDKGDLDNFHKHLQDVLCNWLGFNDRRVVEIHSQRVVDKTVQPHVEVVIRETERVWASGSLIDYAKAEAALLAMQEKSYHDGHH